MSTNEPEGQEVHAAELESRQAFGIDSESRTHYWFPVRQLVVVTANDEIVRVQDVDNLNTWRQFIAQEIGWEWNRWTDKTIGELALAPLRRCA